MPGPNQGDKDAPAPSMFGRVIRKDDPLSLRELLIDYRILTLHLKVKPKLHITTGPSGSLTLGVQIGGTQ